MKKHQSKPTPPSPESRHSRREKFAAVRRSTVALVLMPRDFGTQVQQTMSAGKAPVRPLASISVIGTGFKVAEPNIFLTAKHVVQNWMDMARNHVAAGTTPDQILHAMFLGPGVAEKPDTQAVLYGFAPVLGIASSNEEDIAALHIDPKPIPQAGPMVMPALPLSKTPCEEGDEVATCGFPFGTQLHADQLHGFVIAPSFFQGIVSAALPFPNAPPAIKTVFQVDAMINGGNSGGAVFDVRSGHVVGITVNALQHTLTMPDGTVIGRAPTGIARAVYIHRTEEGIKQAIARVPEWQQALKQRPPSSPGPPGPPASQ